MRGLALLAGPIVGLALIGAAAAAPPLQLDTQVISAAECTPAGSGARQVVDVSYVLTNYADSGYAGEWAADTVNRHLRIWRHSDGTYCAQVQDTNSAFVTLGGFSPSGEGGEAAGIKGTFYGGYITTEITGKFVKRYPTQGQLGTFDARCESDFVCPGTYPTWASYFVDPSAEQYVDWGWIYTSPGHGTWLDESSFTSPRDGDIN